MEWRKGRALEASPVPKPNTSCTIEVPGVFGITRNRVHVPPVRRTEFSGKHATFRLAHRY